MIPFHKIQGIGNDFVVIDDFSKALADHDWSALALIVCERNTGVGADGLIVVDSTPSHPFRMRMWNPDGSESSMCGNGTRCVARYLDLINKAPTGILVLQLSNRNVEMELLPNRQIRVNMGEAIVVESDKSVQGYNGTFISISNPHYVIQSVDLDGIDLEKVGPKVETDIAFPDRTNVHFIEHLDDHHVRMRTWERGAGITLACGSGACSVAVAAVHLGLASYPVRVDLPGGSLTIEQASDGSILMTGPAELSFVGSWPTK